MLLHLMIVCPECGKQTRVKHKLLEDENKQGSAPNVAAHWINK